MRHFKVFLILSCFLLTGVFTSLTVPDAFGGHPKPPKISDLFPVDGSSVSRPLRISASYEEVNGGGINLDSVTLILDDVDVTAQSRVMETGVSYTLFTPLTEGQHSFTIYLEDANGDEYETESSTFTVLENNATEFVAPEILNLQPADGSVINHARPEISADYSDSSGINRLEIVMILDGNAVTLISVGTGRTSYTPPTVLSEGNHSVILEVPDNAGNIAVVTWTFTIEDAPVPTSTEWWISGDPVNRVNICFVNLITPSSFSDSMDDLVHFNHAVQHCIDQLFNTGGIVTSPLSSLPPGYKTYFNFYTYHDPYSTLTPGSTKQHHNIFPFIDHTVYLKDSGGGVATLGGDLWAHSGVFMHEFAHAFGRLTHETTSEGTEGMTSEPWMVNKTINSDINTVKWREWVDRYPEVVGLYESQGKPGVFRPEQGCRIGPSGGRGGFCYICREELILRAFDQTDPYFVDPEIPLDYTLLEGESVTISPFLEADLLLNDPFGYSLDWFLNGDPVGEGLTITVQGSQLSSEGGNVLECYGRHLNNTDVIRKKERYSGTVTFNLSLSGVAPELESIAGLTTVDAAGNHYFINPHSGGKTVYGIKMNNPVSEIQNIQVGNTGAGGPATAILIPLDDTGRMQLVLNTANEISQWTTVSFTAVNASGLSTNILLNIGWLPGDINQNGDIGLPDAAAFGALFNEWIGKVLPEEGPARLADMNEDGDIGLPDAAAFGAAFNTYIGTSLPDSIPGGPIDPPSSIE